MTHLIPLQKLVRSTSERSVQSKAIFYKTGPGEYAEHDKFLGRNVPELRVLAKEFYKTASREDIQTLLDSPFNEERLLALFIMELQYKKADQSAKEALYQLYLRNLSAVNNWNLVDASSHVIVGAHLYNGDRSLLLTLAHSQTMWERRVAIVATWYFIRKHDFEWTLKIAKLLLEDSHDLIHKAVGWMLREMGKKDTATLVHFLDTHAHVMPRTMLRYALEKFSEEQRKKYLLKK